LAKIRLVIWRFKAGAHFLPLHLNNERKSGKDLEMTAKCAIFVRRRKMGKMLAGRVFFREYMPWMNTDFYQKKAIAVYRMQFLYIYCIL